MAAIGMVDIMTRISRTIRVATLMSLLIFFAGGINVLAGTERSLEIGDEVKIKTSDENDSLGIGISSDTKQGFVLGCENDILNVGSRGEIRLDRVVKNDGRVLEYPLAGAQYDSLTQSIFGMDKSGNIDSISITEIDRVDVVLFVGEKQFPTGFDSKTLHDQLRLVDAYPEVLYEIQLDSITEIKRWKKRSLLPIIVGTVAGGIATFYSMEPERSYKLKVNPGVHGVNIVIGAAVGGVIGFLFGKSRWREVSTEELTFSFTPTHKESLGLTFGVGF